MTLWGAGGTSRVSRARPKCQGDTPREDDSRCAAAGTDVRLWQHRLLKKPKHQAYAVRLKAGSQQEVPLEDMAHTALAGPQRA